ncbi:uncharacterized protein M6B38_388180 [Iris pallida]|uniref:Uncharacterized protein n=1 Tax=Iris pallida TaxID=29817 RepID=A0AAX6G1E4_IRIPA|nr:uncharacterized protein M6B38_388180 [Iris pallida]
MSTNWCMVLLVVMLKRPLLDVRTLDRSPTGTRTTRSITASLGPDAQVVLRNLGIHQNVLESSRVTSKRARSYLSVQALPELSGPFSWSQTMLFVKWLKRKKLSGILIN